MRRKMIGVFFPLVTVAVLGLLLGGCRPTGPAPGIRGRASPKTALKPLPPKTAAIAGIMVNTRGGTVNDGAVHQATLTGEGGTELHYVEPVWSPDGRWVAFQGTQGVATRQSVYSPLVSRLMEAGIWKWRPLFPVGGL